MVATGWLLMLILSSRPASGAPGDVDTSFDPGLGADYYVYSVALQPDGKALIGGGFTNVNGIQRKKIARLNTNGSLDHAFMGDILLQVVGGANGPVFSVTVQTNNKILIAGDFTVVNGVARSRVARMESSGFLDNGFNPGTGANGFVSCSALQSDGKLLVGGDFTMVNNTNLSRIARLNTNGIPDGSFDPGIGANGAVWSVAVQTDDKVLIGGEFTAVNGTNFNGIARLDAFGSPDMSFNPGSGITGEFSPGVYCLAIQPDGKILIGGYFTRVNNTNRNGIARLNGNGSLDTSFNPGTGADGPVYTIAVQADGKVLIGGDFTMVNDTPCNHIARLNSDGSLDATFNPGTGPDGRVFAIVIQPDGKILVGGWFANVNGFARGNVVRLLGDAAVLVFGPIKDNGDFVARFKGTPGLTYALQSSQNLSPVNWQTLTHLTAPTNDTGLGIGVFELRDAVQPSGQRFYRAVYPSY